MFAALFCKGACVGSITVPDPKRGALPPLHICGGWCRVLLVQPLTKVKSGAVRSVQSTRPSRRWQNPSMALKRLFRLQVQYIGHPLPRPSATSKIFVMTLCIKNGVALLLLSKTTPFDLMDYEWQMCYTQPMHSIECPLIAVMMSWMDFARFCKMMPPAVLLPL